MLSKGTAHSFLLVSDGYLDNHDSGGLVTEVKMDSSLSGGCITIVADPLHMFHRFLCAFHFKIQNYWS